MDPVELLPYVDSIARKFAWNRRLGWMEEDVIGDARLILLDLLARFDPTREVPINAYLGKFIPCRLLDLYRYRELTRKGRRAVPAFQPLESIENSRRFATNDFHATEANLTAQALLSRLDLRSQRVLQFCSEGEEQADVAALFGIHQSRVCQIRSAGLKRLREISGQN